MIVTVAAALVDDDGRTTGERGVVIDVTERRRAEVEQRRHNERLAALVHAQRVLAHGDATIEQLFDQIPELALGVGHADGALIELVDGESMICRALTPSHSAMLGMRYPMADSLSGEALRLNRTLPPTNRSDSGSLALAAGRLRSVMATVIRDGQRAIGVLKLWACQAQSAPPS